MYVNMKDMLKKAKSEKYGVGAFNFNDFSDAMGIVDAAEQCSSPVILMTSARVAKIIGPAAAVGIVKGLSERLSVLCTLHLDHAKDFKFICDCIRAGYTSVMIDASDKSFYENIEDTKRVVDFARDYGVTVEGELGTVGGKEDDISNSIQYVDPGLIAEYVEKTGVDALAVGIGTVHGFYKSEPKLRFDLIYEAASLTYVPLVLHGGTGVSNEDFKKAITNGITKLNVGTELKYTFTSTLRNCAKELPEKDIDPRSFMQPVRLACQKAAEEKMKVFGCVGKGV